jgi:hypothetical protein
MLILPDADQATFLKPYVEEIVSSKSTGGSPLSALRGYGSVYGENNYDEGTTDDESDELEDEVDYEGESNAFSGSCLCHYCNDPYDDDDDYEVTAEDLMF